MAVKYFEEKMSFYQNVFLSQYCVQIFFVFSKSVIKMLNKFWEEFNKSWFKLNFCDDDPNLFQNLAPLIKIWRGGSQIL
jgi:hypothetical protein